MPACGDNSKTWAVAAGVMHQAIEQKDRIDFGKMFAQKNQFVLEVNGDSMIEAHIADGDYVIVTKRRTASPGDMVVAQTEDGEATLKYWYPEKSRRRIRLQPADAEMKPIYVKDARVVGVVSGVVRKIRWMGKRPGGAFVLNDLGPEKKRK